VPGLHTLAGRLELEPPAGSHAPRCGLVAAAKDGGVVGEEVADGGWRWTTEGEVVAASTAD
jgi:hypothetical protein